MTIKGYKNLVRVLALVITFLFAFNWILLMKIGAQRVEMNGAWGFIAGNDRMRQHLSQFDIPNTVEYLNTTVYAKFNLPNRYLNNIMERERDQMVQDLLMDLRKKTGEDLGSDPKKWIKKYSRPG